MAVPTLPARPVRPDTERLEDELECLRSPHTNTMDVSFDRVRHLVVDDERYILDIDTTTSKVGRDQDF